MKRALIVAVCIVLLASVVPGVSLASGADFSQLEPEPVTLVIGGSSITAGKGFLKNFTYLTDSDIETLAAAPSGEATYRLGLGDCFSEMLTYSTFENHGTPVWIYRRVYGLDIKLMAEALGVDTGKQLGVFAASSDGMTKTLPDAFNVNTKRYSFSTTGEITGEIFPIIALFETTSESGDSGHSGSTATLPVSPVLGVDSADRVSPLFGYGQTAVDEINSCYWVKDVVRLRIGSEDPALAFTDASGVTKQSSISGVVQNGVYTSSLTVSGNEYRLTGLPLKKLLESAGLSLSAGQSLTATSADGEELTIAYSDIGNVFAAWYATENGGVVANSTAFQLYNADGSVFADLASISVNGEKAPAFSDMANFQWASEAVEQLYAKGIVNGVGDGLFAPSANIKRGDFILMLSRAYGLKADVSDGFDDVPAGSYYHDAIAAAKALGIAKGDGGSFHPEASITRQEAMTLIYRTLAYVGAAEGINAGDLSGYADAFLVADWAHEAVSALVGAGVINGSDGRINPLGSMTRAEMSVALYRAYQKLPAAQ